MEYWRFLLSKVGKSKIIIPGADGAIIKGNQILLVKNKNLKQWFIPGGLQDLDESVEQTVVREIKEEIGIETRVDKLISVYSDPKWAKTYTNGDTLQSLTFFFLMEYNTNNSEIIKIDKSEISDWGWFGLDALPEGISDYSEQMCNDLKEYKGSVLMR